MDGVRSLSTVRAPARSSRLGEIVDEREGVWTIRDHDGDEHPIDATTCRSHGMLAKQPQWMVKHPIPAYCVGEKLRMSWRERIRATRDDAPPDWIGEVIDEDADTIVVRSPHGSRHVVWRVNGHEVSQG